MEKTAAIIYNPSKENQKILWQKLPLALIKAGYKNHIYFTTTPEQTGKQQAEQALEQKVDLILAAGGDGTVGAVANALANSRTNLPTNTHARTQIPLGIIPIGTGNLFARNLGLPILQLNKCIKKATNGKKISVDAGQITASNENGQNLIENEVFLVVAGMGFDAKMISSTAPVLKKRLGWSAYFISGIKHLFDRGKKIEIEYENKNITVLSTSVMIGNSAYIPPNIHLFKNGSLHDGLLDLAIIPHKKYFSSWVKLFNQIVLRKQKQNNSVIIHKQCKSVMLKSQDSIPFQIDGEFKGNACLVKAQILPDCLTVLT